MLTLVAMCNILMRFHHAPGGLDQRRMLHTHHVWLSALAHWTKVMRRGGARQTMSVHHVGPVELHPYDARSEPKKCAMLSS
eukprot:2133391-Pyramimonas_sp.AAC.1